MTDRRRATLGAFVVAAAIALVLELTVLEGGTFPFGLRALFIAGGAAGGTWLTWGELE